MPRNSWKLPRHNFKEKAKCQECVDSWQRKAHTHSYNASRLKFALMCFLEGNTQEHDLTDPTSLVPIDDPPIFTGTTEEQEKQKKDNELYGCGVCMEKMVKQGERKPIIYDCGHSNCAVCFNEWWMASHGEPDCPYCKKKIGKAIRLFMD